MTQNVFAHRAWLAGFALVAVLTTWAQAAPVDVTDAQGRQVRIADASRIVSVGGAITEILYALGLERQVIGVDSTSLYPPRALKDKPNVGYMRQLSPEGVLGLGPSLVLANDGSGPLEAVAVLEAASIPFVRIPDRYTAEGIVERIRLVARAVGVSARGECLVQDVEGGLAQLAALRKEIAAPARVIFVLSFANGKPMVAGRGTAADGIITLAGAVNAFADFEGYKTVSDEAVVAAKADAVLGMERSNFRMTAEEIFRHPAFRLIPAAQGKRYISMDGLYLLGFGPRTAQAASDLAHALYPTLAATPVRPLRAASIASCRQ
jgi:iron complex transport system substrate-binding protein